MNSRSTIAFASFFLGAASWAQAATVAKVDSDFVGKVSQGGSFEVMAGQLAVDRAMAPDVKSFAEKDVAAHVKVNDELKTIAAAQELPLAPKLDSALQAKLDRLAKLSGPSFDKAYMSEIVAIHHKDEGIFSKEAKNGASDDWKAFAAKTDDIVKGHIASLDAMKK